MQSVAAPHTSGSQTESHKAAAAAHSKVTPGGLGVSLHLPRPEEPASEREKGKDPEEDRLRKKLNKEEERKK